MSQPAFFQTLNGELKRRPLADWKRYLRWHLVNASARYLSRAFVEEDFAFYGKVLAGTEQLAPRWKRCVRWVDRDLGEALGQVFVQKNFSPELKEKTLAMVQRHRAGDGGGPPHTRLDVPPTQTRAHREAQGDGQQDRLPRSVA